MGTGGRAAWEVHGDGGEDSVRRARLLLLARACSEGRTATVTYSDVQRRQTQRELTVLGLGWRPEGWLYLAECRLRSGVRLFRLDRTGEVLLGAPARTIISERFDPRAFASTALQQARRPALLLAVTLGPPLSELARVLFPQAAIERHGGRTRVCHVPVTWPRTLEDLVRSLGAGARIGDYCTNPASMNARATSS